MLPIKLGSKSEDRYAISRLIVDSCKHRSCEECCFDGTGLCPLEPYPNVAVVLVLIDHKYKAGD